MRVAVVAMVLMLYIADDQNNRVLRWTDAAGVSLVAELPLAPCRWRPG